MKLSDSLIEKDITKAYTAAFEKINKVPVFNEFDIWKPYKNEPIKDFSLYIVQANDNSDTFFDEQVSLCYGKFLNKRKYMIKQIFAVKTPSNIKK